MSAADISCEVTWRAEHDGWRAGWWLSLDGGRAIPVGGEMESHNEVLARCKTQYVGEPPPDDHAKIWGGYVCSDCGAHHVRLWRDYSTCLDSQTLRCRACAIVHSGKPEDHVFAGDSIGWQVPAVPTPDGETFWGYTSVPLAAVKWWQALPESKDQSR